VTFRTSTAAALALAAALSSTAAIAQTAMHATAADTPETFHAARVLRTASIRLNAPPERVFPLFTPEGERHWAEGWDPVYRYPASGVVEPHAVFVTRGHGGRETIWTVLRYDPPAMRVAYDRVTPGLHAAIVEVACEPADRGGTLAHVTYTFTGLSDEGNAFVEQHTGQAYRAMLAEWESAINRYLATGQTPHAAH
jgi:hypothetical protein